MRLGICEVQIFNLFELMKYRTIAPVKAADDSLSRIIRKANKELVRIYKEIAKCFK